MSQPVSDTQVALAHALGQVPSVTQILSAVGLSEDYSRVPPATLEIARLRGTALHAAIQWHHEGTLNEASLHPEVAPGFSGYLKFLTDSRHEPIVSEAELVHPTWRYVGHPDRIGWIGKDRVLIDFKYMESLNLDPVARQLAGYRLAWNVLHPTELLTRCYALQLKRDGTYRSHEITQPRWSQDDQVFLAACVVFRARKGGVQ